VVVILHREVGDRVQTALTEVIMATAVLGPEPIRVQ